jgi:hypothetical protein
MALPTILKLVNKNRPSVESTTVLPESTADTFSLPLEGLLGPLKQNKI